MQPVHACFLQQISKFPPANFLQQFPPLVKPIEMVLYHISLFPPANKQISSSKFPTAVSSIGEADRDGSLPYFPVWVIHNGNLTLDSSLNRTVANIIVWGILKKSNEVISSLYHQCPTPV